MRKTLIVLSLLLTSCNSMKELTMDKDKFLAKADNALEVNTVEQTLLNSAQSAERMGDYKVASQYYQQLMDMKKSNKEYAAAYADAQRKLGQPDLAISVYDSILAQDAGYVPALEGKAVAYLVKGAFEPADQLFMQAVQRDPNRWRSWNGLGITRSAKESYADAKGMFEKALALSPNNTAVMNNQGLLLAIQKDLQSALNNLRTASTIAPNNSPQQKQIDLNLALVYAVAGDLKNAEAIAAKYYSGAALSNNLGFYAHVAKNNELASTYLNMALTQSPTYYERAWRNLEALGYKDNAGALPSSSKPVEQAPAPAMAMPAPAAPAAPQMIAPSQIIPMEPVPSEPAPAAIAPASGLPAPAAQAPAAAQQPASSKSKFDTMTDSITDWFGDLVN